MKMVAIDESIRSAVLRLTQAERECLKRCLSHQTAKQMALDLGISAHAVEKRLKMARAKLGLSSSVEAAKLVEALERSGQLGPQRSDLSPTDPTPDDHGLNAAPHLETAWLRRHRVHVVSGAMLMSIVAAITLFVGSQSSVAVDGQAAPLPTATAASRAAPVAQPTASTEAVLRSLVDGLASGSPDYAKLSPQFAEVVRRDLPMTHPLFRSLGQLQSMTFRERAPRGDEVYTLRFANGDVIMSAALDADGRMAGGFFQPVERAAPSAAVSAGPRAGTEAALRTLVAGLASGSPDYAKLSPQFAEIVRRDLPMTHPMFQGMGALKSVTFRERGPRGDDAYHLVFANGEVIMSAGLDTEGRMMGGLLQPVNSAAR